MAYTAIDDPSAHFQALLYTGDGGSDRTINFGGNSDLQPDFLWVKKRSGAQNNYLANTNDSISKVMYTNTAGLESNETSQFKSVHSDGWVQGSDNTNTDTATFVAWGWKSNAGTRVTFTESGNNPAGGYQVNTTAGFSIIDYTGTLGDNGGGSGTFAHGLSSAPTFWVVKPRAATAGNDNQWFVCHQGLASDYATDFIHFDTTGAKQDNALMWNDTAPTSSVITVGSKPGTNDDGIAFICYAWHDVQGFSKFGSYKGNGNADGPFVYTGFKPAFLMIKRIDGAGWWTITDNKRNSFNPENGLVAANVDDAEYGSSMVLDFLSNGFKLRVASAYSDHNESSDYIYMAFAESPFVTSGGVPATAR